MIRVLMIKIVDKYDFLDVFMLLVLQVSKVKVNDE